MYKIIFLEIFLVTTCARAQELKFYDAHGQETDSATSYYYSSTTHWLITQPKGKPEVTLDSVNNYYTSTGKMKSRRTVLNDQAEGTYAFYYESGRIQEKGAYHEGKQVGYATSYYRHGRAHQTVSYSENDKNGWPLLINYWDSIGNSIVTNGNGFCECTGLKDLSSGAVYDRDVEHFAEIRQVGKIVGGKRDSVWQGYEGEVLVFTENYTSGEFINGVSYRNGVSTQYKKLEEQPEFPGGLEEMMKFIAGTMRYPADDRRAGIEGRVFIGFVVDEDGRIGNVTTIKGIAPSCDREAMRTAALMPHWKPGRRRGVPVRVRFVLPVNFKLED